MIVSFKINFTEVKTFKGLGVLDRLPILGCIAKHSNILNSIIGQLSLQEEANFIIEMEAFGVLWR